MFDFMKGCCTSAIAALDGVYGKINELIAIVVFVLVFNFFAKWMLKKLHLRFEKQKKIWKDSFVQALYLPLSYYVWFFAFVHVFDLITFEHFSESSLFNRHVLLDSGALIAFSWFLLRWKNYVVKQLLHKSKNREITIDHAKIDAINKVATVTILFFTVLILLEITDRSLNTIIAFGGIGGLAIAFASQEIISNFFGGLMIYLTQPFIIGDWVHLPERDIEGIVEEIGWYMTRIRTLDKRPVYIPNSIFTKLVLVNPSRMSHRQINETLAVRPSDIGKLKDLIQDIKSMLETHPEVDHRQTLLVRFKGFGEYSLNIQVYCFIKTIDTDGFARVKEEILFKISDLLKKHNCDTAMPAHTVHYPKDVQLDSP